MGLSEKQKEIFRFGDSGYDALICDGAIRTGKSSLMTAAFIDWAMERFDRARFGICGKTADGAAKNLILPYLATSMARRKYATSSDGNGDYSRFVCYLAATGHATWPGEGKSVLSASDRAYLLRVARLSLERAVRGGFSSDKQLELGHPPKATLAKMGAFVTLNDKATGALRGCIGEILPMRPLVEAVAARAVDAARRDPRFTPVSEGELGEIRVEVSALTPPRSVASWRDIVLGRDGMTLEKNGHFAVFLPQVAPEQGWDVPTTLSYLSQKAGLSADAWREGTTFETFQAEVFHE